MASRQLRKELLFQRIVVGPAWWFSGGCADNGKGDQITGGKALDQERAYPFNRFNPVWSRGLKLRDADNFGGASACVILSQLNQNTGEHLQMNQLDCHGYLLYLESYHWSVER
jgi:hypothetical protein